MDSKDIRNLCEAYTAVYDEDLRHELETFSLDEDFSFVDDLSDNELVQVMESILLDGEYTISECIEIFDDAILTEESEMERMNRIANKRQREKKAQAATAIRAKNAERERVGRKHAMKRIQVATGRAAQNISNKAKTLGAGAVSAVAGGAAELGRKLSSAKKRIEGFMGRVGNDYRAAKKEFFGQAGREANARVVGRQMRRAARNQAAAARGRDTSAFQRPKAPSGSYRNIGAGQSEKAGGTVSEPTPTAYTPNKERIERAKKKLATQATGERSRGIRFAGPSSSQVIGGSTRLQGSSSKPVSRKKAAAAAAKELNLNHYEYLLDAIFEDMIYEGYADTYEEAFDIITTISEDQLNSILDSYLEEEVEVETLDLYDTVMDYLLDEGFADTEESAEVIMANMSEEWREEILESRGDGEPGRFRHRLTRGVKKVPGQKTSYDNMGK